MAEPVLIAILGAESTGKTTLARLLLAGATQQPPSSALRLPLGALSGAAAATAAPGSVGRPLQSQQQQQPPPPQQAQQLSSERERRRAAESEVEGLTAQLEALRHIRR